MSTAELQQEALSRAVGNQSTMNYGPIFSGFIAKGIDENDIRPRENIFTFRAWLALGRAVRKGEHGVKVTTWIPIKEKKDATGKVVKGGGKTVRTTTVFHVSQTDPVNADPKAPRGWDTAETSAEPAEVVPGGLW